jgi:hypothetical protein
MALASISLAGLAAASFVMAGYEPIVPISALKIVEDATNRKLQPDGVDPWEQLGDARGTYLPGYGAVFTFEMSLVNVMPLTPFRPEVSPQEVKTIHDRKIRKLPLLKTAMRELMVHAASSLTTLPATEQITFEAVLDNFSFEDRTGLPRRLTMTVVRQKLLDAAAHHVSDTEIANLIEVREE